MTKRIAEFHRQSFFATIFATIFSSVTLGLHLLFQVKPNKSPLHLTLIKQSLLQQNPSSRDSKMTQHILDVHYGSQHNKHVPKRHMLTMLLHRL